MPGRKLNIPLIKGVVMAVLSFWVAVGSALSGIGAQVAAVPIVSFMLGFAPEKSAGTAMAFTLFATGGAVTGMALGATIGTALALRHSASPRLLVAKRIAQPLAIMIGVWVIGAANRPSWSALPTVATDLFQTFSGLAALLSALIIGALSQLLTLSTGVFFVPVLLFLFGFPPAQAIELSLLVVFIASILPAFGYSARGLVDRRIGPWMALGGALGGLGGGYLLSLLAAGHVPLILFGLAAMFLSAWTLWKMT